MKRICKFRLTNKYFVVSLILLTCTVVFSWITMSYFGQVCFFTKYSDPQAKKDALRILLPGILTWERTIDSAMYYMVYLFPLFPCFSAIGFQKELKEYWGNAAIRTQNLNNKILLSLLFYSVQAGVVTSGGVCVFLSACAPFMKASISNLGGFMTVFPNGFYMNHPYITLMIIALTVYFSFGFIFGMFACSISMLGNSKLSILFIPELLYLIENFISAQLGGVLWLAPSTCVCAYNTTYHTFSIFKPLLPIGIISIVLICLGRKKGISG